jgi:dTMP kinase
MSGRLISFEGGEGAGKSTMIAAAIEWLRARGIEVLATREPGGTPIGERIRSVLLDRALGGLCAETELLLMFAARAQLVRELIRPALERGGWVVTDRFTDASFAYQGGGRGQERGRIAELERWVVGFRPDLSFLLDVDVATGLQRARSRGGSSDRIETESDAFFERVRSDYRRRAQTDPQRWRVVDATQPEAAVMRDILGAIETFLATDPNVHRP